jgi:hypothetical protein
MLEYYANIAEIIGVVSVVVTLVFLILQIRQNTQAIRAETIQAVMQSEMALSTLLVEHADVWAKVLSGASLAAGAETRQAIILYGVVMVDTENRFHQFLAGYLDTKTWQGRMQMLPKMVSMPIFPVWRQSFGGQSRAADFLDLIDGIHATLKEQGAKNG